MWNAWFDLERTFAELDALRRHAEHDPRTTGTRHLGWAPFPHARYHDAGDALVIEADVPGLEAKDLDISATAKGVTLSGQRSVATPQGYDVQRQERQAYKFSRNFNLPVKIDPDQVDARLDNGVLTVRLRKATEVQPRRIQITN